MYAKSTAGNKIRYYDRKAQNLEAFRHTLTEKATFCCSLQHDSEGYIYFHSYKLFITLEAL